MQNHIDVTALPIAPENPTCQFCDCSSSYRVFSMFGNIFLCDEDMEKKFPVEKQEVDTRDERLEAQFQAEVAPYLDGGEMPEQFEVN